MEAGHPVWLLHQDMGLEYIGKQVMIAVPLALVIQRNDSKIAVCSKKRRTRSDCRPHSLDGLIR